MCLCELLLCRSLWIADYYKSDFFSVRHNRNFQSNINFFQLSMSYTYTGQNTRSIRGKCGRLLKFANPKGKWTHICASVFTVANVNERLKEDQIEKASDFKSYLKM